MTFYQLNGRDERMQAKRLQMAEVKDYHIQAALADARREGRKDARVEMLVLSCITFIAGFLAAIATGVAA